MFPVFDYTVIGDLTRTDTCLLRAARHRFFVCMLASAQASDSFQVVIIQKHRFHAFFDLFCHVQRCRISIASRLNVPQSFKCYETYECLSEGLCSQSASYESLTLKKRGCSKYSTVSAHGLKSCHCYSDSRQCDLRTGIQGLGLRNGDLGIGTKGFRIQRVEFRDWDLGQKSNKSKEATSEKVKKQPAFLFACRTLISKCDFSKRVTESSKHRNM